MLRKKKKYIIIAAATDFPHNTASATLIRRFAELLTGLYYSVEVLLLRGSVDKLNQVSKKRTDVFKGIRYSYCSFKNKPKFFIAKFFEILIGSIVSCLKIFKRKFAGAVETVIIYTGYPYYNLPIVLSCKLLGIKVIKLSVDWYDKGYIVNRFWYLPKWWFFSFEIKRIDKLLDGVIVLNYKLKEHYLSIGFAPDKLFVMPAIIDINNMEAKSQKKEEKIRIGYCGSAPIKNGVDDLIKAFHYVKMKYPYTELVIIGDVSGGTSEIPILKSIAKSLDLDNLITFTGRVSSNKIAPFILACDILVLPRKQTKFADYGFPTKLAEYFSTRKPVVITRVGDFPLYFEDKNQVVFSNADDPVSLANAIIFLCKNVDLAKVIGNNGYLWALENIDSAVLGPKIKEFIELI